MSNLLLPRDRAKLVGVNPRLISVVERAREKFSFIVVEGLRTAERQALLKAQGFTQTLNSRHLTGHAVDLAPWDNKNGDGVVQTDELNWKDAHAFRRMATVVLQAADDLGVYVKWGGNFPGFFDGPHFELDTRKYRD